MTMSPQGEGAVLTTTQGFGLKVKVINAQITRSCGGRPAVKGVMRGGPTFISGTVELVRIFPGARRSFAASGPLKDLMEIFQTILCGKI